MRLAPASRNEVCKARKVACPLASSSNIAEDHKADEMSAWNSSSSVVPYYPSIRQDGMSDKVSMTLLFEYCIGACFKFVN